MAPTPYSRSTYPRSPYLCSPPNSPALVSNLDGVHAPSEGPSTAPPLSTDIMPPSSYQVFPSTEQPALPALTDQPCPILSFPACAQPPSDPLHLFAFLPKKPVYAVDCNVAAPSPRLLLHVSIDAALTLPLVDLIAEAAVELFTNFPDYRINFQEMVQVAVHNEVLNIYNNKDLTRFFQQCAGQEMHQQIELARARIATANSAHARMDGKTVETATSLLNVSQQFSHLPTDPRDASHSENIGYTNSRRVNKDRLPFATYITPHAPSEPPYYWVPYGYAIGVFSKLVWSGGQGLVGHEVSSLEEALNALENVLREGHFSLIH
ncbi:hypothetical protein CONPUDRAFT_74628 [Coniophora puteana RWD-64-598 SS2]|uniref:Uncharacterized protein n=1 Tax=Coniophora puteana (strain RWD-64-598) TaxID=741705 RepID=A0A5M3MJ23_CONPW|nr:uncharacterized protein CONPUDRAFT_74628 [Coniophora puteana RWD-64-598 SS2]EIW79113.1 hypothetical protein CONPUDRAFT_74628 [Coniophora puteana RWD-64-598 SS2]